MKVLGITASILHVCKSRSTHQNKKENCTEVEDHIWTKINENQEDLSHSISEVGWTLQKVTLRCYFWIPHLKIKESTNFYKNSVNQTNKNMNKNTLPSISKMATKRMKEKDLAQTFNRNTSETIWGSSLKVGTFAYLHSMYIMLQISLKSKKVGFRHVPLWCGISHMCTKA